jgi:hypothetical protein
MLASRVVRFIMIEVMIASQRSVPSLGEKGGKSLTFAHVLDIMVP